MRRLLGGRRKGGNGASCASSASPKRLVTTLSAVVVGLLLAVTVPAVALGAGSEEGEQGAAAYSTVVDADTRGTYRDVLGENNSTRYAGRVWTDKSVSDDNEVTFATSNNEEISVPKNEDASFQVTYSALATSQQITKLPKVPVDVVYVLDFSRSMAWKTGGTVVGKEDGSDSRIKAMVDALNRSIDALVNDSDDATVPNRVGIAYFNRWGKVLLPLTELSKNNVENIKDTDNDGVPNYLDLKSFTGYSGEDGETEATVECHIGDTEPTGSIDSVTNIQAGLAVGMNMLAEAEGTTFIYQDQTFTRIPNIVLMSDGAPTTIAANSGNTGWTSLDEIQNGYYWGDNDQAWSANGLLPMLTAEYYKQEITNHYKSQQNLANSEQAQANMFTIGFSVNNQNKNMVALANMVLNPGAETWDKNILSEEKYLYGTANKQYDQNGFEACSDIIDAWKSLCDGKETTVQYTEESNRHQHSLTVNLPEGLTLSEYPTYVNENGYFSASNASDLDNAFQQITNAITESAKAPTEVIGNPVNSGYITYTDPIGKYMEIKSVDALVYGNTLFEDPEYDSDEDTYTFTGNVTSPVYSSQNVSNISIKVSRDEETGQQTLEVKIPASVIPIRVNEVDVNMDGTVERNEDNGAMPLRLVYSVGLADGVLDENGFVIEGSGTYDSIEKQYDGVAPTDYGADDDVSFYSNAYSGTTCGSDDEKMTVGDATVEFTPSIDNPFYFIQENTPLYTADSVDENGAPVNPQAATGTIDTTQTYYFKISYFEGEGSDAVKSAWVARSGSLLEGYADNTGTNGQLELQKGAPRLGNLLDIVDAGKGNDNKTVTAQSFYYPTFVKDEGVDNGVGGFKIYLGNNGVLKVEKPAAPAGNLSITKTVTSADGLNAPTDAEFTFSVSLYDSDKKPLSGSFDYSVYDGQVQSMTLDDSGAGELKLKGGETAVIDDLPAGTQYVISEIDDRDDGFNLTNETGNTGTIVDGETSNASFTNTYSEPAKPSNPSSSVTNDIKITKVLTGDRNSVNAGEFRFTLEGVEGTNSEDMRATGTNDADGNVTIDSITFTAAGEYKFTLREVKGNVEGMTYDSNVYTVVANVEPNAETGQLEVSWSITEINGVSVTGDPITAIKFHNTYKKPSNPDNPPVNPPAKDPDPVGPSTPDVDIDKTLTGRDMVGGEFSFIIETAEDYGTNVSPKSLTGTSDANGKVTFNGGFTFKKAGTYKFTVSEKLPTDDDPDTEGVQHNGVTYDQTTHTVVARVTNKSGKLEVAWEVEGGDGITFENSYELSDTVKVSLGAKKVLNGRDLKEDEFTFQLKNREGEVVQTVTNAADGSVVFDAIEFTEPGTYTYYISEVAGGDAQVTYDNAVVTVVVTVADNGDGTLTATVTYNGSDSMPTFVNTYTEPKEPAEPEEPGQPGNPEKPGTPNVSTDAPSIPQTGDSSALAIVAAAIAGVVLIAGGTLLYRKSRR